MFSNVDIQPIIISPPFGTFLCFKWSTSVVGTFTKNRRLGKWPSIIRTLRKTEGGWSNKIGLKNPGLKTVDMAFKFMHLAEIPTIFSVHASNTEDWIWIHEWLKHLNIPNMIIEMNISCPNVICQPVEQSVLEMFATSFYNTILKLPPQYDLAMNIFNTAHDAGISNFHCCNTLPTHNGGESGHALKPYSLKVVENIRKITHQEVNIIGGGGIYTPQDVDDYHNAGANMLSLSTIFFTPWKVPAVRKHIRKNS
jgi:dihydroorotate dehydrogenase